METRFLNAAGSRLQYFEHGSGPKTVVFVHGFSASGRIWGKVQRALDTDAFRSIALSNRGAGGSDRGTTTDDYTVEAFARDLYAAVEALGLRDFTLCGHSLGAATAARYALGRPSRVRALVLLNPVPLDGRTWPEGWQDELRAMFDEALKPLRGEAVSAFDRALRQDAMRNPAERREGGIASMAALDLRRRLHELPMPVLVAGGDQDEVVGVGNILAEYLALPPRTRSLQVFHGVGHSPNIEAEADLAAVLARFIGGSCEA